MRILVRAEFSVAVFMDKPDEMAAENLAPLAEALGTR